MFGSTVMDELTSDVIKRRPKSKVNRCKWPTWHSNVITFRTFFFSLEKFAFTFVDQGFNAECWVKLWNVVVTVTNGHNLCLFFMFETIE